MSNQVLVLNSDFTPLNVTTLMRGFVLVQKERAEVVTADVENPILTGVGEYVRPIIIRLVNFVSYKRARAKLTRNTIFERDGHVCQYDDCTVTKPLTIDHVHPKSRGGKNTWKNMVACCDKHNTYKDNMTPEEAGLVLKRMPFEPSTSEFLIACNTTIQESFEKLMSPNQY